MSKFTRCLPIAAALVSVAMIYAGNLSLTKWKALPPLKVRTPFLIDSLDAQGIEYEALELLTESRPRDPHKSNLASTIVEADTAGVIRMDCDTSISEILEYCLPLRADRYAEGELKISSPLPFRLFVNGEEAAQGHNYASRSVRLEPATDYDLTLMFLSQPNDTSPRAFGAALILSDYYSDVPVSASPDMKRRFSLPDTEYSGFISGMSVSPDGRKLLSYTTTRIYPEYMELQVAVTDLNSGKVVYMNPEDLMQWMPVSNKLSVATLFNGAYNIYIVDPADGSWTLAAEKLPENNYWWSPDEKLIFFQATDAGIEESGPLRRYTSPDDRIPGNRDLKYIAMFDPESGQIQRITRSSKQSFLVDFHPKDSKILIMANGTDPTQWPFSETALYEYNYKTGVADTIIGNSNFISAAQYSPDGKQLLITASAQEFGGIADRSNAPIANIYDKQLFIYDIASGKAKALTADFDPSVGDQTVWNKADGKIYFIATKGFGDRIFSYDPKSGKFTELPLGIEHITRFHMNDRGSKIAYTGMSRDHLGQGRVYDVKTGKDIVTSDPSATRLANIDMSKFERWNFTSSDGTEIEGYAIYPPDFDPQKKYPLIVYYYGGTLPTQFSLTSPYNPQLAAAKGYVVYMLNPSGTIGYGQEFSARHVNAWGKRTAEDIIEGTKKFVKEHPFINEDKIGCIGASYGGFMTQYLQTLTDIYAAAVSHAGISNVTSYWGEGYWGYSYNGVAASKSYPWQNPELFTQQGSLFNADKIHTPLLLLHGTYDTNVPIGESIQLFNALKILDREVELITVEGEDHHIRSYVKRKQWYDTFMAWFAKWLQDDPRWWDTLYPN